MEEKISGARQRIEDFVLFRELATTERTALAGDFETIFCPRETVLLTPGQEPEYLYLVARGKVVVEAMGKSARNRILAELETGDFFPLEAMFEERPIFSTLRITEDAILHRLSASGFHQALKDYPGFMHFCRLRSDTLLDKSRHLYSNVLTSQADHQSLDSPLSSLVRECQVTCSADTPLRQVLQDMGTHRAEVAVVVDEENRPQGIFTLYDLLHRVTLGNYATDGPIAGVMTREIKPLPGTSLGSQAALVMARHAYRQVIVVEDGKMIGLVNEKDLFGLQRVGLAQISDSIHRADQVDDLIRASEEVRRLSHNLLEQGVRSDQLTQIISTLHDQITERLLWLFHRDGNLDGVTFCWLALGSEGRNEQTLSSDQDNAIVFKVDEGQSLERIRNRLQLFSRVVNTMLDQCGFPLCKGGIMASNPRWCLSLPEWESRFKEWMETPEPEALLHSTIFFDFRPLYGDETLAEKLRSRVMKMAKTNNRFLHLMVESALQRSPPLGLLRDFVTDSHGAIDLKLSGITLFVDAARVFSLAHGLVDTGTRQRLSQGGKQKKKQEKEVNAWIDAFDFLQHLRLRLQHRQYLQGKLVNNLVEPASLNELDRRFLIESLRQAGKLQKHLQSYKIRENRI